MKIIKNTLLAFIAVFALSSCGSDTGDAKANAEGFNSIEQQLKSKFGDAAYYTNLAVINIEGMGNSVNITVTEDPASLQMGEWNFVNGKWTQNSTVTIEIPEGTRAKEFMFQLDEGINLKTLGGLIEKAKNQLTTEKQIENPKLHIASIQFPDTGNMDDAKYLVSLKPEHGGTTFSFYYKLDREFIEMTY